MSTRRKIIRVLVLVLFGIDVLIYIAAKIDFFKHYGVLGEGAYVREHSIYWVVMAALGLLIWLIERLIPEKS
jgi:hypothetical protein